MALSAFQGGRRTPREQGNAAAVGRPYAFIAFRHFFPRAMAAVRHAAVARAGIGADVRLLPRAADRDRRQWRHGRGQREHVRRPLRWRHERPHRALRREWHRDHRPERRRCPVRQLCPQRQCDNQRCHLARRQRSGHRQDQHHHHATDFGHRGIAGHAADDNGRYAVFANAHLHRRRGTLYVHPEHRHPAGRSEPDLGRRAFRHAHPTRRLHFQRPLAGQSWRFRYQGLHRHGAEPESDAQPEHRHGDPVCRVLADALHHRRRRPAQLSARNRHLPRGHQHFRRRCRQRYHQRRAGQLPGHAARH